MICFVIVLAPDKFVYKRRQGCYISQLVTINKSTMLSIFVVLLVSLISILYVLIIVSHGYWRRKKIPQPSTTLFGGSIGKALSLKKNLAEVYEDIYR